MNMALQYALLYCGMMPLFLFFPQIMGATIDLKNKKSSFRDQSVETRGVGQVSLTDLDKKLSTLTTLMAAHENHLKNLEAKVNNLSTTANVGPWLRGRDGKPGKDGRDGRDGSSGSSGRDGRDGKPGINADLRGPKGDPGPQGRQGPQGPIGPKGAVGVQYVRWGKTSCPTGVVLVYKGRVGGESYDHAGGASQYVCLPEDPQYKSVTPGHQNSGYMYGAEYEVNDRSPFTLGKKLHDHEVPCAVCYVTQRAAKMMVPARYECPAGWVREYQGYLMTAYHTHHSTQYICVDQDAEYVTGTHGNKNGATLYPVEGRCGSLPCLPYVDGNELTCAVCTK